MRALRWCTIALTICTAPAAAVTLQVGSATVAMPGDFADVCVTLDSGGAAVAGTQNDLVWDGDCATLASAASCRINPATGKDLHARIQGGADFDIKLLVLSLSNVDPIPDGELYCCRFRVEAGPGGCCRVAVRNALASDPRGQALPVGGNSGQLCVQGTPGVPTPTIPGDGFGSNDGCQTTRPLAGGIGPTSLALAALLAGARRRLNGWRAGRAPRRRRRAR